MKKNNKLYSIREAAKACGIGRTTLQRMTDEGLVPPAFIGENKYHFYDCRSIYDINMLELMSECGFTRKEIGSIGLSPDSMAEFASKIQDKINILNFNLENLRAASITDNTFKVINIPSLTCCTMQRKTPRNIEEMYDLIETLLSDTVKDGYHTNKYYPPFLILKCEEFSPEYYSSRNYDTVCCIPVLSKSKDTGISNTDPVTALSITFQYSVKPIKHYFDLLNRELRDRDLAAKGYPRLEALFNPFPFKDGTRNSLSMRLSVPI